MGIKTVSEIIGSYEISSGITKSEVRSLASNKSVKHLQFSSPLSLDEIRSLEKIVFAHRPDVSLRVYGHYFSECDLSYLIEVPSVRMLSVDCLHNASGIEVVTQLKNLELLGVRIFSLQNFDFLNEVSPRLKKLLLHSTKSKKPRIDMLGRFEGLEYLYLEGQQKGIESISKLRNLKEIVLRSISTPNLEFLRSNSELWSVDIKLGGIKNFDALQSLPSLKYLELWQIRGLSDLSFISKLNTLQNLFIQSLRQVTELPDLSNLTNLRRIYLENLNGLKHLDSLENAPSLEEFALSSARNLEPRDLIPVLNCDALKRVSCYFGSSKKNTEFRRLATQYGKEEYIWTQFEYR